MTAPAGIQVDLWRDVRRGAVNDIYQTFRVALAGAVSSFARDTTRATLRLMVNLVGYDLKVRPEVDAVDIPVIMPGGGGYTFAFDMRQDDPAVVVCCDGPVRGYYETGGAVTPVIGQSHDFGCAVAFPGGRVSSTLAPTAPPNNAGEAVLGATDGSATLILRGAGLPTPTEAGTVVIATAGPVASLLLGGTAAALGVARLSDEVVPDATWTAFATAVAAFVNGVAPGSVVVPSFVKVGIISTASEKVVSE
jgi:hypothetical protein